MKCLVTGGAGFVGSNLVNKLQTLGHHVTVVDNFSSGDWSNLRALKGTVLEMDLSRPGALNGLITERFDVLYHQAAITDPRFPDDQETVRQNVRGFQNVLTFAMRQRASLVYASTASLYGNGPAPQREDQPKQILSAYAKSKLIMDEMASRYGNDLRIVGLRYFNVFGPGEQAKGRPASMVFHLIHQMMKGRPPKLFKWGEQRRDHVPVEACVRANLLALDAPSGVYNVGTGRSTSFNELVDMINAALGKQLEPEYIDMAYDPTTYQMETEADLHRATSLLGFVPNVNLTDAIADYAKELINMSLPLSKAG